MAGAPPSLPSSPSSPSASSPSGPTADPWIGRTVAGRFAIVRRLGEGGSGRVYLAEQAIGTARRRVALKMLLPEHASNPEMVARFSRECETVSVIEHTNVVRLYDFGETDGGALYIAMELVPGCSLGALIAEEGALEPRRALDLFAQICRGVSAAHDRDIIHRDLKPDNLMVVRRDDEPEVVKVLDFGIAKTVGASGAAARPLTRLGTVIGSPAYMSPEQLLGGEIDVRTDVYALGVVAYEMLTGVLPFDADDIHGWAAQHIAGTPQSFASSSSAGSACAPMPWALSTIARTSTPTRCAAAPSIAAYDQGSRGSKSCGATWQRDRKIGRARGSRGRDPDDHDLHARP